MDELSTRSMHQLVDRYRGGDADALNELYSRTLRQLERLAHKMLKNYPGVLAREETGDVVQNAVLRLSRALQEVKPESVRQFYGLAAEMIRRELLDLVRLHGRRPAGPLESIDPAIDPMSSELDRWTTFHSAIEKLPTDQREVFSLAYYHRWSQAQIAELLQISDRQVRRVLQQASMNLQELVGGTLPEG